MNKTEAIQLLNKEGWTKEDAKRALKSIDFKTDRDVDEMTVRQAVSQFAGLALIERQKSQAIQKRFVTLEKKKVEKYLLEIETLKEQISSSKFSSNNTNENLDLEKQLQKLNEKIEKINKDNKDLVKANTILKKDNKDLKNIVDAIKFKFTVETKHLLELENSEIRKGLIKLLNSTLG